MMLLKAWVAIAFEVGTNNDHYCTNIYALLIFVGQLFFNKLCTYDITVQSFFNQIVSSVT